jgi:ABC-2 type transport system permease protein
MVANAELLRVRLSGWRTGLANLLRKENRAWWASRRWLMQGLLWALVVDGLTAVMLFIMPWLIKMLGAPEMDSLSMGVEALFKFGSLALAFGAVILVQDAILGERQLGVTEWLLSKPVSRPAYVLSKLLAHGIGVLVILVILPGVLGYGLLSLALGEPFPLPAYLVGMVGLAVHTLFYLTLTLMLGVLTANRRVLLGTSMGLLLGGLMIIQVLALVVGDLVMLTPWALGQTLPLAVLGTPLPVSIWLPIGVTAVLSVLLVAVTLTKFERLEF